MSIGVPSRQPAAATVRVAVKLRHPDEAELPIVLLRRAVADLERAGSPVAAWFAKAEAWYEAHPTEGFGRALGLVPMPGATPWWEEEARQKRNAAIRTLWRRFYPDMSIRAASRAIATAELRYQATASRHDPRPSDPQKVLLAEALQTGQPFPGARQIETILRSDL